MVTTSGFCWSVGTLAPALILGVYGNLMLYYLVYQVKLDPAAAAALLFVARMADIPFAPIVGIVSDHTHSRWGRRRPYLLAATILTPIGWMLMFNIPVSGMAAFAWALFANLLLSACYSIYNIPHMAMANEITDVPRERVRLMSFKIVFLKIGGLLAGLTPLLIQKMPGQPGYLAISLCLVVACGLPMLISFLGTGATPPRAPTPAVKLTELFHGFGNNRPFIVLTVGSLASLLLAAGQMPIMLFFIQSVMKLPVSSLALFAVGSNVVALISVPLWARLIKQVGMKVIRDIVVVLGIVYCLSYLVAQPGEPIIGMMLRAVLYGLIIAGWQLIANTMQADVIDYDFKLTGRRREGLFSAFFSFSSKTAAALGVLGVGVMLSTLGFDKTLPPTTAQGPAVTIGLFAAMAVLPALGYVITFISYRFYQLDPGRGITPETPLGTRGAAQKAGPDTV